MGKDAVSETMEQGECRLFVQPDVNAARDFFRARNKSMVDKTMAVREAVQRFVSDGDYLAVGGFGTNRIPTALLHEVLRQGRTRLGLSGHTATHDFQILAAGGAIDRVDVAYVVGLEARGLSRAARRLFEEAKVEVAEWTNAALAWRYKAAVMGVPFIPARTMLGTDTFKKSAAKTITCPYTGMKLLALPALIPDVAFIHVHRADRYGNAQIDGITVADFDVARAAKKVILTTERLVSTDEIRKDPSRTSIPHFCVDAVCEVRFGSYPGNMAYEYFSDEDHLREWLAADSKPETLKPFLDKYVYGTSDFREYLELCGGEARMEELRRLEFLEGGAGAVPVPAFPSAKGGEAVDNVEYNPMELMICLASRYLEDGCTVVVGTGAPCAATMLAQKTRSPNLTILFEAGGVGPVLPTMPISVGDSRTFHKAIMAGSMIDVMDACQRGVIDYCFLGGAQIDMYGNINSTVIGDFAKPKVRFPGSGGANDLASLCWRTMVITPHDPRRFVEKVDFITTPGYLSGKGAREAAGLPPGTGPYKIITNLCVMGFDEETCRMKVESVHPGITRDEVVQATGFELMWATDVRVTDPPTLEELRILRDEVDPMKYIISRQAS